jgi:hypothetical protein
MTLFTDGYRLLLLAVIYRAVLDARAGDTDAREWLTVGEGRDWAEALGIERWPPKL